MAFAFIKHDTKIDFIGKRHIAYVISILLLLVGLGSALWGNGLRMGIDFAGGVIVQVQFAQPVEDEVLKKSLDGETARGDFLRKVSQEKAQAIEAAPAKEKAEAKPEEVTAPDPDKA